MNGSRGKKIIKGEEWGLRFGESVGRPYPVGLYNSALSRIDREIVMGGEKV